MGEGTAKKNPPDTRSELVGEDGLPITGAKRAKHSDLLPVPKRRVLFLYDARHPDLKPQNLVRVGFLCHDFNPESKKPLIFLPGQAPASHKRAKGCGKALIADVPLKAGSAVRCPHCATVWFIEPWTLEVRGNLYVRDDCPKSTGYNSNGMTPDRLVVVQQMNIEVVSPYGRGVKVGGKVKR